MEICPKIDVHAHAVLFSEVEPVKGGLSATPEEVLEMYDKVGVDRGILLPILSPEAQMAVMPNGNTWEIARRHPDRFFWFCNVDPRMGSNSSDTDLGAVLRHFKALGAKGMGELTANLWADDPRMDNLFYHCAACDMPVTIHVAPRVGGYYGIADDIGLPRIRKMLQKHPNLKILGHSQPFWAEIGDNITEENRSGYHTGKVREGNLPRLLRECPNLYLDLSAYSCCNALTRDPDFTYRFIEEFADRMLFAIDYCNPNGRHIYEFARFLDESARKGCISEKNYRAICRENAIRILKLDCE